LLAIILSVAYTKNNDEVKNMIAPENMNLVSNYITAGVALTTALQVWETVRPVKGRGLIILLGDFPMLGAIPWLIAVAAQRAALAELMLSVVIGVLLAIPLILSTKFIVSNGVIRFKRNIWLYLFLIGIPVLRRYVGFIQFFKNHPIFIPHSQIPDIELMIVLYVTVIVVNIYVWRIVGYLKYRKMKRELPQET